MQDIQSNDLPLLSFIVPCYNLPVELIRECLRSILALPLSDAEREIIVVDDGSDTSPINEIEEINSRCIYMRQPNKGLAAARNTGLRLASGTYIQFVDGDDKLIGNAYSWCLDILKKERPDMLLFLSTSTKPAAGDSKDAVSTRKVVHTSGRQYMLDNNMRAAAWGYVFKKSLLGGLLFDESLRTHEDECFTPQLLLRASTLLSTDVTAYYYRPRAGSLTATHDRKAIDARLANIERIISFLHSQAQTMPAGDHKAMSRRVAQLTMDYLYNIIHLTHDGKALDESISRLRQKGLFPLPDGRYTLKYTAFRLMISNRLSRRLMLKTL